MSEPAEGAKQEPMPWHRLFGLSWADFFRGTAVTVELEKDLSLKQQLLDVVLLRTGAGALARRLPDGFEDLAAHNLVSFKSYQEALDGWALNELVGHYVNYREQVSPTMQELLPEGQFRLFAVSVRYPQALARQVALAPLRQGVYEVRHFTGSIRLVVVHQLPQEEHNAMLHLFSASQELVDCGARHYRPQSPETSSLLYLLWQKYRQEGLPVPETLEDLVRIALADAARNYPDELVKALPPEMRLQGLSPEQRLQGLSPEELRATLEALQRLLQGNGPPPPGQ